MEAMEDKSKQVIEACERLCPKRGDSYKISESIKLAAWPPAQPKGYGLSICGHWIYVNGDTTPKESDRWDLFYSLLSLGVQSPAPDENGLLPCAHCGGKMHVKGITKHFKESNVYSPKWGAFCKTPMCDGARRVYKHHNKEGAIIAANTRAHAPIQEPNAALAKEILANLETYRQFPEFSLFQIIKLQIESIMYAPIAGKDPRSALMAKKAAFRRLFAYQAKLWGNRVESEKAKSAKLIGGLESAKRYCETGNGRGGATSWDGEWINEGDGTLYNEILTALSAYKEAKEGGGG